MSTAPPAAEAAARPAEAAGRMRWFVVGLLGLGVVIAYFDRVNLSVAIGPMAGEFSWTATQQGQALSAFFITYTLLQVPMGLLTDRFGMRTPYILSFMVWSSATALTALTGSFMVLILIRLLVGIGEAIVTPASMRYIREHFEERRRGLAIGLYFTGTKVGPALAFVIVAYLVSSFGWRGMFVALALGGLIWIVPFVSWIKKEDPAALPAKKSAAVEQKESASAWAIVRSPVMIGTFIGTFCYMYFVYYCMTWMPSYLKETHGMSIKEQGWYSGVAFGGMSAVIVFAGWASDRLIARGWDPVFVRKAFIIAGFLCASTQTIGAYTDSASMMLFFAVFSLCGLGLLTPNYWALTQTLLPGASIGMVVGIQNMAANLPGIVAPWLTGWLVEQTGSFDAPIKTIAFWLVLGIASYVFLVRRKYAPGQNAS